MVRVRLPDKRGSTARASRALSVRRNRRFETRWSWAALMPRCRLALRLIRDDGPVTPQRGPSRDNSTRRHDAGALLSQAPRRPRDQIDRRRSKLARSARRWSAVRNQFALAIFSGILVWSPKTLSFGRPRFAANSAKRVPASEPA